MDFSKMTVSQINQMVSGASLAQQREMMDVLAKDHRTSVNKIAKKILKNLDAQKKECERIERMKSYEKELYALGYARIAGIDEVGRGPLAGPVVAAAVILPETFYVEGINDSKKVPEKKRHEIFKVIQEEALAIGIGIVDRDKIDEINILNASKLAMQQAVGQLAEKPDYLLIDAVKLEALDIAQTSIIKGDEKSVSIAAASIIAKVIRDEMMIEYDREFPGYDFASNKGYGTKNHLAGLEAQGATPIHRRSFLKNFKF